MPAKGHKKKRYGERHAVEAKRLREAGISWSAIARALSVSCPKLIKSWVEGTRVPRILVPKGHFGRGCRALKDGCHILTPEKGYIVGVTLGDGCLVEGRLSLQAIDEDFVREFSRCVQEVYGLDAPVRKNHRHGKPLYRCEPRSHLMTQDLFGLWGGAQPITERWCVPKPVFDADETVRARCIRGWFDSDGGVVSHGHQLQASSKSRQGIQDMQRLLLGLEIDARLCPHRSRNTNLLYIGRDRHKYMEKVGFTIARKANKVA
jgi:hypothetical protein